MYHANIENLSRLMIGKMCEYHNKMIMFEGVHVIGFTFGFVLSESLGLSPLVHESPSANCKSPSANCKSSM